MNKTVVINAVGLTPTLMGSPTPRLRAFRDSGKLATIETMVPAVTTSVQSTYLTGKLPTEHGIVGNGWYFRDECEIHFWKQAGPLVQRPRIWELARQRDASFTCANLFWWYAMYCGADYTVTPRPMYPADGRKLPDVWAHPGSLRDTLQKDLGTFPLFKFWGPATSVEATQWIARAAIRIDEQYHPALSLIYLPHLDYVLQKVGPDSERCAKDLAELDAVIGTLLDHFQRNDTRIVILSEYGISPVNRAVHLNRVLRGDGFITVRVEEAGRELLDAGASAAFAVADHQIAHIYVNDRSKLSEVRQLLEKTAGVGEVWGEEEKKVHGLDHSRSGDLVVLAEPGSWFTYYYWLDDAKAPDFARTVDIHRKPGYDPVELFLDPTLAAPKMRIITKLLKRKLGFRALLDVIGLDASLVRGSHGIKPALPEQGPMLMTNQPSALPANHLQPTDVCGLLLDHIFS